MTVQSLRNSINQIPEEIGGASTANVKNLLNDLLNVLESYSWQQPPPILTECADRYPGDLCYSEPEDTSQKAINTLYIIQDMQEFFRDHADDDGHIPQDLRGQFISLFGVEPEQVEWFIVDEGENVFDVSLVELFAMGLVGEGASLIDANEEPDLIIWLANRTRSWVFPYSDDVSNRLYRK